MTKDIQAFTVGKAAMTVVLIPIVILGSGLLVLTTGPKGEAA